MNFQRPIFVRLLANTNNKIVIIVSRIRNYIYLCKYVFSRIRNWPKIKTTWRWVIVQDSIVFRKYELGKRQREWKRSERSPKEVETRWENNTAVRECWRNDATSYRLKRLPMWFLWAFSYQKQYHRRYNLQHICLFSDIRLLTYFSPLLYIYLHIRLNVI